MSRLGLLSKYDYWLAEYSLIIPQKSITTSVHIALRPRDIMSFIITVIISTLVLVIMTTIIIDILPTQMTCPGCPQPADPAKQEP